MNGMLNARKGGGGNAKDHEGEEGKGGWTCTVGYKGQCQTQQQV